MFDHTIDERLHRLNKELGKLLNGATDRSLEKTTPEQLVQLFGLTLDEAKSWLEREPNFTPSDEFLQRNQNLINRWRLDRTLFLIMQV
jgi:hypothetical protein